MSELLPRALTAWAFPQNKAVSDSMVFVSGARQVGKTALARSWAPGYVNWDTPEVKRGFLKDAYFFRDVVVHDLAAKRWVVFDEVHKRRDWKKLLKGYYDSPSRMENFIVTGSGRFDQYQRGGDSLAGRYDAFQLWPLVVDELEGTAAERNPAPPRAWARWEPDRAVDDSALLSLGGFPAPFLSGSAARVRRWQDQYLDRLIKEDVRDFSAVQRLDQLELLARLLPERLMSPVSTLSLAEDLGSSTVAVKSWLRLFETVFLGFALRPYHRRIHRAVKKETKWYFQQWTFAEDPGARFENYLAVQLSAACSAWSEQGYGRWELYYLRDQDRREIDFLIARDLKPQALIEAKSSPQAWTSALHHYTASLGVPGFLLYPSGPTRRETSGWSLPAGRFLSGLILA